MAAVLMQDRVILNKKYPFLANFPFSEFSLEVGEMPIAHKSPSFEEDEFSEHKPNRYSSPIIKFVYEKDSRFSINIHEKDLLWIYTRSDQVNELDIVSQILNAGLESSNLLEKRDATEIADDWIKKISDSKTMLAYSTFSEVLSALIGDRQIKDTVQLINSINKLANKKGLVQLNRNEYGIIDAYYNFRLIYTRLILGIVIASKISL
jgi:hypothetical protein